MAIKKGIGFPDYGNVHRQTIKGLNTIEPTPPGSELAKRPDYGKKRVTVVNIDLSTARTDELYKIQGTVFWVVSGSSAQAAVTVQLDDAINDPIPGVTPGFQISGFPFRQFYITNTAQPGESLSIVIFRDYPDDRVLVD